MPPAGWFPDPANQRAMRWWDGQAWTDHVADVRLGPDHPPPKPRASGGRIALVVVGSIVAWLLVSAAIIALLFGACVALLSGATPQ
jgi:hypothetical protein